MIPTKEECFRLMKKHNMFEHIMHHSLLVTKVALYISDELNKAGESLDLSKVQAGALLHDITKTISIKTGDDHSRTGSRLMEDLGFKCISEIVRQHVRIDGVTDPFKVSEIEVVNYSDKRVKHDQVVSLKERFDDLKKRYGINNNRLYLIGLSEQSTSALEKKIFSRLKITPDALLAIKVEKNLNVLAGDT